MRFDPIPQHRRGLASRLFTVALAIAILVALFVLPSIERREDLQNLTDGAGEPVRESLRRLCGVEPGQRALRDSLEEMPRERRLLIVEEALDVGCAPILEPAVRAEWAIEREGKDRAVARAVREGSAAIEPALSILSRSRLAGLDRTRRAERADIALRVLVALQDRLDIDQRRRALARIEPPVTPIARALVDGLRREELRRHFVPRIDLEPEEPHADEEEDWVPRLREPEFRLDRPGRGRVLFRGDGVPDEVVR